MPVRHEVEMRFFKTKWFKKFAASEDISETALKGVVAAMDDGNITADLGGFVYKQRLARQGAGKSGGYRILLFYRKGDRVFFVYGFAKSDRANIDKKELESLKKSAAYFMHCPEKELDALVRKQDIIEF